MRTNIALTDLEAFVAISEHLSFNKAATVLHLSPSALTRRLNKLEETLGVTLADRTTRSVKLTALGLEFQRRARDILDEIKISLHVLSEGTVRHSTIMSVACVPSATEYFLPPVFKRLRERMPLARVRLLDFTAHGVVAAVKSGEAEFGIGFLTGTEPGVAFTPLLQDSFVLACHRGHPLAKRKKIRWKELEGQDFIAVAKGAGNRLVLDRRLSEAGLQLPWFYEVRHLATSLALVERGLGMTALPRSACPRDGHPTLALIPLVDPVIDRTLGIIRRRSGKFGPSAQLLHDLLMEQTDIE